MSDFLKKIDENRRKYSAIPFWSWNNKLEDEELDRQIQIMKDAEAGGFFMHSRGGLKTEYLSDDFLKRSKHSAETAKKLGLKAWAYDEYGWPSGFANGVIPKMGYEYKQKSIHFKKLESSELPVNTVACYRRSGDSYVKTDSPQAGDLAAYLIINDYYIDALNSKSIEKFLEETHEKYVAEFGEDFNELLEGFFTDEPQYANGSIPYSEALAEEYTKIYGEDITDSLFLLDEKCEGYETFRYRYYLTANKLFTDGFMKQMYYWCESHGCKLTGHLMAENDLISQMRCTAGVMPSYEYLHIPGMDWLCRMIEHPSVPLQLSSACEQLGKEQRITETFALCGWDVSLEELKWIAAWQYINGVNMTCQHLEPYSMQGFRKRDFPPAMFYQSAWYTKYDYFNRYFDRLAAALAEGDSRTDLLLIHPMRSAYILYNANNYDDIMPLTKEFADLSERLNTLQIEHHYGDETLIERHGSVTDGKFVIGKCSYSKVLLPDLLTISEKTFTLLCEFAKNGGKLFYVNRLPEYIDGLPDERTKVLAEYAVALPSPLCGDNGGTVGVGVTFEDRKLTSDKDIKDKIEAFASALRRDGGIILTDVNGKASQITVRGRDLPDGSQLWYIANLNREITSETKISKTGNFGFELIDLAELNESAVSTEFDGTVSSTVMTLAPMQTVMLKAVPDSAHIIVPLPEEKIIPSNDFKVVSRDPNCITLDYCRCSVDGGDWEEVTDIVLLNSKLLELRRPCSLKLEYSFEVESADKISGLQLVCETPEKYKIYLNGKEYKFEDKGYFVDTAFRRSDLPELVNGKNTILFETEFYQRDEVYHVLFGENIHETERNKLTYDSELEAIYIIGDFSVRNNDECRYAERKAIFTGRDFTLCPPVDEVDCCNITESGYWFFRGEMEIANNISVEKKEGVRYIIEPKTFACPAAELYVNGKYAAIMAFSPFKYDVTDYLKDGINEIKIKIYASNRNLLGPFHREEGESYAVSPWTFQDPNGRYDDGFVFVKFGIEF